MRSLRRLLATAPVAAAFVLTALQRDALAQRARRVQPEPPPSPVALEVQANPRSLRWRFSLTNRGSTAVEVAIDRNMLGVEITPAPPPEPPPGQRRRAARPPKVKRCRGGLFHSATEDTARMQLTPNQSYAEGIDLRSLCGVRLPATLTAGASLVFTYGSRGRRPSWSRAVVFLEGPAPIEELRTEPMQLGADSIAVERSSSASESAPLRVSAPSGVSADRASGVVFRTSVRTRGPAPRRLFYRPSMFSVELVTPRGVTHRCSDAPRGYVGLDDYVRTVNARGGPSASISLALLCGTAPLTEAGVYRARVVFESDVEPEGRRSVSFRGRVASEWFPVVLRRGSPAQRYQPLPETDPFATAAPTATRDARPSAP
ncbi:MAG: hypothetical protein JNK05_20055 [Myxococcales bacterium]|nr:hypothetical protein [Myxococcales bacterium]